MQKQKNEKKMNQSMIQPAKKKVAVAQCCAKVSSIVAGCHD